MRDAARHFLAEFVGVFALVFVGSGAIMAAQHTKSASPLLLAATAHGLILAIMVTATMRISGHLNPAITLGFLAARRIEPLMAGIYVCAQILGAIAAAYVLKATLSTIACRFIIGVVMIAPPPMNTSAKVPMNSAEK